MNRLENRLKHLEATLRPVPHYVGPFICDGRTPEQAIRAAGYDPNDAAHSFVCRVIIDPPQR